MCKGDRAIRATEDWTIKEQKKLYVNGLFGAN
jgi:hypothetical protein